MKIFEAMRRARARLLHPLGRYHLRRQSDRRRAGNAGRRHLEERHDRGQGQGRRDACTSSAATTPTTCWTTTCAASTPRCRSSPSGTTTRPRTTGIRARIFRQDPTKSAYKVTSAALLGARAARAFQEYMPVRWDQTAWPHLYRSFGYGPSLEIFRIDMRSYRGPNTANRQAQAGPRDRVSRRRPDPLAEAGAAGLERDLEGDRVRHADRPCRGRRRAGVREPRQWRRPAARARARDGEPVALHPRQRHPERGLADRRRALYRRPLL